MIKKWLHTVVIVAAIILIVAGYYIGSYIKYQVTVKSKSTGIVIESSSILNDAITVVVEVKHYRNDKLIGEYKKIVDPLTRNFIAIIVNTFFAQYYTGSPCLLYTSPSPRDRG